MAPTAHPSRNEPSIPDPTQVRVSKRRAAFLAKESGLDVAELAGRSVAEVNELIRWRVDPQLLLYRRICGQVVKRDPATGELCPVPGATVHIEDTDCTLFGFFPVEHPDYFWMYPVSCSREELTTVTTDACGRFCVNLPYWDVDRVLRFRIERICFPDIYRLRLRDIIDPLPEPPDFRDPRPQPDPLPFERINPEFIERMRSQFGGAIADRLAEVANQSEFGAATSEFTELLDSPLPSWPPPLPKSFRTNPNEALAEVVDTTLLEQHSVREFSVSNFLGPFIRCKDVLTAEWAPFFDVPDITFRVTQDVDGDGVEEQIYGESYFDVRWNAGSGLNVILEADASALCVQICQPPVEIPCLDEPAISGIAEMSLGSTYHSDVTGYGLRFNRPTATGDYPPPPPKGLFETGREAFSPYAGVLRLFGCHRINGATHYRLTYSRVDVTSPAPPVPFTGITWNAPLKVGGSVPMVPDADGWYPINPAGVTADHLLHPNWLLLWNTNPKFFEGTYELRLEVGISGPGGITLSDTSDPRKFKVDNKRPDLFYNWVRWRYADGSSPWALLPPDCPVINRDPKDIRIRVSWTATAPHLRNARIDFSGCGDDDGDPLQVQPTKAAPDIELYREWYTSELDITISQINEFEIPAAADPGCYTLRLSGYSRGFQPGTTDGPAHDWYINHSHLYSSNPRSISLVNK